MKSIRACAAFCILTASALAADHNAWQWQQAVDVATPGIQRLDLPPATLHASLTSLDDLRLLDPGNTEIPWLLEHNGPQGTGMRPTKDFRATIDGRSTILTAIHDAPAIDSITLVSPARSFLKSARVDGSQDGTTWQPLVTGEVIFRQTNGAERMRIPLAGTTCQHLRVTIDDGRSSPVAFTGLHVTPTATQPETIAQEISIIGSEASNGESRLTLNLGARNLNLAEIRLDCPDGVFSRACRVHAIVTRTDGTTRMEPLASGTIYRVLGEDGTAVADLRIPLHQRVASDKLLLTIFNGDSPPLEIRNPAATRYPDRLVFYAKQPGPWRLITGNRFASHPAYDLGNLRTELERTPGSRLIPGPLTANPSYQAPPSLSGVDPAGSPIDPSQWARRRSVNARWPAVVRIELDAVTLAHMARGDLGDLRLVQGEKQIPWLLEPTPAPQPLTVRVEETPNPKQPHRSLWKLTLPVSGLPTHDLTAISPDPLFTRTLHVSYQDRDELGNRWTRRIGSATWTKTPGQAQDAQTLRVPLAGNRVPDTLWLETDNGDNPPIRLDQVTVHFLSPVLVAKVSGTGPVFLCYDNPHAEPPVYDLDLVRAELLKADKQPATLGDEEILKPGRADDANVNTGSPWLWAALALVVAILLAVVAKMLPRTGHGTTV